MSRINSSDTIPEAFFEGERYAVVVGVNESLKTPSLHALKYAETDAQGMSYLLNQKESGFIFPHRPDDHRGPLALVGSEASTQNVREAVIKLLKHRNKGNLLLFYFIGHGYLVTTGNKNVEAYLVTADFDPDLAENDPTSHLSLSWLRQIFFERNETADVIVVLDCCHGGYISRQPAPEEQFLQSFNDFAHSVQAREGSQKRSERFWAILTSAGDALAYEDASPSGEGHTRMTGLILAAFSGRDRNALENGGSGNLTLQSLHSYLDQQMGLVGSQYPVMLANLKRRCILAHLPASNPLRTTPQDFIGESNEGQRETPTSEMDFFDRTFCQSAAFRDLNLEEVDAFFQKERVLLQSDYVLGPNGRHDSVTQMEKMGMLRQGHPTYGALLCFGNHPTTQLVGAFTRCIYWKDTTRVSGWRDDKEYQGGLLQQFTEVCKFLKTSLNDSLSFEEPVESDKLPFRALQEALANALVHREYVTGSNKMPRPEETKVEIFSNRIEISSSGAPPDPINVGFLKEILEEGVSEHAGSHARNPQIARIFYLAGHVEKAGSGIQRIQQWMEDADLPVRVRLTKTQMFTIALYLPHRRLDNRNTNSSEDDEPVIQIGDQNQPPPGKSKSVPEPVARMGTQDHPTTGESKYIPESKTPNTSGSLNNGQSSHAAGPNSQPPPVSRRTFLFGWSRRVLVALICLVLIGAGGGTALEFALHNGVLTRGNQLSPTSLISSASTTIEIASDFPISGADKLSGLPLQNGVEMAITEANHNNLLPGYKLKLVPYDDTGFNNQHDPQKGAQNIQQAISDSLVAGIVGPGNSGVVQTEAPIANQAPIALVSPDTTYPCLTKTVAVAPACSGIYNIEPQMRPTGQLTYFRLAAPDDIQGKAAADFLSATKRYQRVVLFKDDTDSYSRGLAQAFQNEWEHLGSLIITEDLQQTVSSEQDYQNALQSLVSFQPDLVYFAGDQPNGNYALKALTSIPALKTTAFAGGDGLVDSTLPNAAATLHVSAPVYASLTVEDPEHSKTSLGADFQSEYIANGYSDYDRFAASAYDCVMMLIGAIRTALQQRVSTPREAQDQAGGKRFRQAVLQALAQNRYTDGTGTHSSYTGATGAHSFDSNGDTTNPTVSFYQADLTTTQPGWKWVQQISE